MKSKDTPIVLVVEDEHPLSEVIRKKLEKHGVEVVVSQSVEQSLEYLKEIDNVRAIWLDHYLLGHENGLDLVGAVKNKDSKWREIPVFVVSNTATGDKINSYIELGVEKYYTKSNYRLGEIVDEVCKSLGIE
jgi:CheY-like chemotaxis protein